MQASPDDIDLSTLWAAIWRNRTWLIATSLLAGALTYGGLALLRPQYTSQATVIVEATDSDYARARGTEGKSVDTKVDDVEVASQVEIVKAPDSLLQIARDKQLANNPEINTVLESPGPFGFLLGDQSRMSEDERLLANMESRVRVYQIAKTRLIAIDFTSRNPQFAADIANATANAYLARSRAAGLRDAVDATESLGGKIDDVRKGAEAAQTEFERFRADAGLLAGQNNVSFVTQQLSELNSQRTQAETALSEALARARLLKSMLAEGAIEAAPEVLQSANMQQLFQARVRTEQSIAELSATLMPAHPRMRQLGGELATLKRRIAEEGRKVVRSLDNEAEVARARQQAIVRNIDALTQQQAASSSAQARLGVLEREAQSKREIYQSMLDRLNDASNRRDSLSVPAKASLNSSATVSSVPVFPKKGQYTMLAMLGTFLLGLSGVVTRELVLAARGGGGGRRIAPPTAATVRPTSGFGPIPAAAAGQSHGMPPLASSITLPAVGSAATGAAAAGGQGRAQSAGQLASLLIKQAGQGPGHRALLTAQGAAGRAVPEATGPAIDVARALASHGRRVLLIDGDGGTAGLAARLGLPASPGIAELMAEAASFEDVVHQDPASAVQVMTAALAASAVPASADPRFALVLDALDEAYDHILIAAGERSARDLFVRADGRFDAAILVEPPGQPVAPTPAGFLGFDLPGLTVIRLQIAPMPMRRPAFPAARAAGTAQPHGSA